MGSPAKPYGQQQGYGGGYGGYGHQGYPQQQGYGPPGQYGNNFQPNYVPQGEGLVALQMFLLLLSLQLAKVHHADLPMILSTEELLPLKVMEEMEWCQSY